MTDSSDYGPREHEQPSTAESQQHQPHHTADDADRLDSVPPQPAQADREEIIRACQALFVAGQVVELRALDVSTPKQRAPHTVSGYFDNADELATAAMSVAPYAKNVYITLNPVQPALLARAHNRVRVAGRSDPTTSDHDIIRRHWLLIDADAKRPSGISSSAREHSAALLRIRDMATFLSSQGWPEPIVADSGNGGHLLYRIDLPADDGRLVKRVLESLAVTFSDGAVEVDTSVFNPARICKLYGSVARKGDSTPERPHRLAHLKSVPEPLQVVTQEQLEAIAARAPIPPRSPGRTGQARRAGSGAAAGRAPFDLERWISEHDLPVQGPYDWPAGGTGARKWIFEVCPFNDAHRNRSATILQWANGAIAFRCLHESCSTFSWSDLRQKISGDGSACGTSVRAENKCQGTTRMPPVGDADTLPGSDVAGVGILLSTVTPQPIEWLWQGRIPLGKITVLDGDPGLGKSLITLDIAARVTQEDQRFPDEAVAVSGGVVLLNVEDDAADTIRPRLEAAGADLNRILLLNERVMVDAESGERVVEPISLPSALSEIEAAIVRVGAVLVVIDPLMAFLGGRVDSHRDQDVRRALAPLALLAQRTRSGILIVRHLNKDNAGSALYRGGGSIGIIGAARSGLIVAPDPDDETCRVLAMTKCNLAAPAPSLLYRIDQRAPGIPLITWCGTSLHTAKTLFEQAGQSEERCEVLEALKQVAPKPLTPKDVSERTGRSLQSVQKMLQRLVQAGAVRRLERGAYVVVERPTPPRPPVHVSTSATSSAITEAADSAETPAPEAASGQVDSGLSAESSAGTSDESAEPVDVADNVIADLGQLAVAIDTLLLGPDALVYLDTETTGTDVLTVHLVSVQLHHAGGPTYILDWRRADPDTWLPELDRLFSQVKVAGHNLAFDIGMLLHAGITQITVGCDTMLAEQVLRGKGWSEIARELSLQQVAAQYGISLDKSEQTAFVGLTPEAKGWQMPFTAAQAAYMRQDVEKLPALVQAQQEQLAAAGLTDAFTLEMAIVSAMARMRVHGVLVDEVKWRAVIAQAEEQAQAAAADALAALNPLYRAAQEDAYARAQADLEQWQQERDAALDAARASWSGANWGARRKEVLAEWEYTHPRPASTKRPCDLNLNAPAQVREALALVGIAVERVDAETLEPYAATHPAVAALCRYKVVKKLVSSFGESMLALRGVDGRWHPEIHQIGADTGRMACSKPNVQQLPRRGEHGERLRQAIVAAPGHVLVAADFSNIELRILAEVSQDETMLRLFAEGQDLHTETARRVFALGPEVDVRRAEFKPRLPYRDAAKTLNFATVYGASPHGIARQLGVSIEEAQRILDEYFMLFPGVHAWRTTMQAQAKLDGFATTLAGRRRYFDAPDAPSGWVSKAEHRAYYQALGSVERAACNHPIQGMSADITKEAIRLFTERVRPEDGTLILVVHDELVVECRAACAEEVARQLKGAMQDACARWLKSVVVPEPEAVIALYWAKA